MALSRNDSRVIAMVILYQVDLFRKKKIDYNIEDLISRNVSNIEDDTAFIRDLVCGVLNNNEELIEIANHYLKQWNISRLGLTDGAILKIALYELLHTNTPEKVCIDEAIELAKDFSDEPVVGMINGVLDKVYHEKVLKEGKNEE